VGPRRSAHAHRDFVVRDDPVQSEQARALVRSLTPEDPGYISLITLVEFVWVLQRGYRYP